MLNSNNRRLRIAGSLFAFAAALCLFACGGNGIRPAANSAVTMSQIPAVRLNYRYEADVPAPEGEGANSQSTERNAAVQADFDSRRTQEVLDRTITSPDQKHVLAVYRNVLDLANEFRLDMYSPDGKAQRKITSDAMAVHFPDTILWSPDSASVAFVAMSRAVAAQPLDPSADPPSHVGAAPVPEVSPTGIEANAEPTAEAPPPEPTLEAPTGILTFRSEQIYTCDAEGANVKAITQNEGLIYFYYVWSPDSTMLAALAATKRDWRYFEIVSESKGEMLIPQGRLRVIEKNGRERRLDDNVTAVRPVWSPDSAKIAVAYGTQLRLYDAAGIQPTQAEIPLRNQLLLSSAAYDRAQKRLGEAGNTNGEESVETPSTPEQPMSTLPDERDLVSYNPIVEVAWPSDQLLYFKTAYLKRMRNEAESVTSFARWHRVALSPQETPAR